VAAFANASEAETVTVSGTESTALTGAVTFSCEAAAAPTAMLDDVPLIVLLTVSVAVSEFAPAVFNVTAFVKACTPASPPTNV
jgi:hypothetical protein